MKKKELVTLVSYEFEPFCVLEGGRGLNDTEEYLVKSLNHYRLTNWVLDNLYDNQRRLMSVFFLRPKTIILGTTGIYREKLNVLIDLFFSMDDDFSWLENIVLTLNSEDVFWSEMNKIRKINPKIKFWDLHSLPSMFDEEGEKYEVREISL